MIISPSRNFIFIHLEKCGGTSVESALQPYLLWSDMIIGSTEFGEKFQQLYYDRFGRQEVNKYMLWKHSTAHDVAAFLGNGWTDFNKIAVIRNPIDLMRSFYFFSQTTIKYHIGRINRGKWKDLLLSQDFPDAYPYTESYVRAYVQSALDDSGIDGFVDIMIKENLIQTQSERLFLQGINDIDLLIDLNDLNSRWSELLQLVGIDEDVRLEKLNASERQKVNLSSRSEKLIKKHFSVDYQRLSGYASIQWK